MRRLTAAGIAAVALAMTLTINTAPVHAGPMPEVESGIFMDYVAPDAGAMTPGSITFGYLGAPEAIAADAELVPPADTNLSFLAGGAPTCLEVMRQGGQITRLAFVESCTVTGEVTLVTDVFGSGTNGYVTSDRIATPEAVVLGDPAINALMKTTADSGGILSVTFTIDVAFGAPTGFIASTSFAGVVEVLNTGDVRVGDALLLDAVIDPASRALLEQAAVDGLEATVSVHGEGEIDVSGESQPATTITLSVTLSAPPSPSAAPTSPAVLPDTSLVDPMGSDRPTGTILFALTVSLIAGCAALGARANRLQHGSAMRHTRPRG
jgi:hypothetical protein